MTSDEMGLRDRAELADRYERWLLDIGQEIGCDHLDERLPYCVATELRKAFRPWYEVKLVFGCPRFGIARLRCFQDDDNWYTIWLLMLTRKLSFGIHVGGGPRKEKVDDEE